MGDRAGNLQTTTVRNPVSALTGPQKITSALEWKLNLANGEEEAFNSNNFNSASKDS